MPPYATVFGLIEHFWLSERDSSFIDHQKVLRGHSSFQLRRSWGATFNLHVTFTHKLGSYFMSGEAMQT